MMMADANDSSLPAASKTKPVGLCEVWRMATIWNLSAFMK